MLIYVTFLTYLEAQRVNNPSTSELWSVCSSVHNKRWPAIRRSELGESPVLHHVLKARQLCRPSGFQCPFFSPHSTVQLLIIFGNTGLINYSPTNKAFHEFQWQRFRYLLVENRGIPGDLFFWPLFCLLHVTPLSSTTNSKAGAFLQSHFPPQLLQVSSFYTYLILDSQIKSVSHPWFLHSTQHVGCQPL